MTECWARLGVMNDNNVDIESHVHVMLTSYSLASLSNDIIVVNIWKPLYFLVRA